jgi:hypothetical protein
VTLKDLIDTKLIKVGQIIYREYKGRKYEGKILEDGSVELLHNGKKFPSLNSAIKNITDTPLDAWFFWKSKRESGTECLLNDFREEYRTKT